MADIDVERKGPTIWPWIVGLLVLAVLVWSLVEMFGGAATSGGAGNSLDTLLVDTMGAPPP